MVVFVIIVLDYYQVVGFGLQLEEFNFDQEIKFIFWWMDMFIFIKVVVFGVVQFVVSWAGEVVGIFVSSWVYFENWMEGYQDYVQVMEVLQFFIDFIGLYFYLKLVNVQFKICYGGMENVSNIFYFENFVIGGQDYEDFIVYEVVYQWFGNSVMEGNWYYIWLSEGFVIYGVNFYIEYKYGWDVMVKWLFIECQ